MLGVSALLPNTPDICVKRCKCRLRLPRRVCSEDHVRRDETRTSPFDATDAFNDHLPWAHIYTMGGGGCDIVLVFSGETTTGHVTGVSAIPTAGRVAGRVPPDSRKSTSPPTIAATRIAVAHARCRHHLSSPTGRPNSLSRPLPHFTRQHGFARARRCPRRFCHERLHRVMDLLLTRCQQFISASSDVLPVMSAVLRVRQLQAPRTPSFASQSGPLSAGESKSAVL